MAFTLPLIGDLADLGLNDFQIGPGNARKIRGYVRTNLGAGDALIDTTNQVTLLGDTPITILSNGTWSVDLLDTSSTDLNVEANTLQYELVVEYTSTGSPAKRVYRSGWFALTEADLELVDDVPMAVFSSLDLDLPSVTPSWRSAFMAEMESIRDDAAEIVGLPTEAAAQAYNIENDPAVQAALSATIAAALAGVEGGVQPGTILATGSSITYGIDATDRLVSSWVALLPEQLEALLPNQTYEMVNVGVGGATTSNNLNALAVALAANSPAFVIIEASPNDFRNDKTETTAVTIANMRKMAAMARLSGATPVFTTAGPINPALVLSGTMDAASLTQRTETNAAVRTLGTDMGVVVADIAESFVGVGDETDYFEDGLHPNDAGHIVYAQTIAAAIVGEPQVHVGSDVIATDTFTRADSATALGTTTTGGLTWAQVGVSPYGISANRAYRVSGTGSFNHAVLDVAQADVILEADITWENSQGFALRSIDVSNHIEVIIGAANTYIYKVDTGVRTALASAAFVPVEAQTYRLRAQIIGNAITVSIDGVQVATYTLAGADATKFAGITKHGIYGQYNGTANGFWDNFQIGVPFA